MCSTRAVAESTKCPCRLTWSQAVAELRQEDPVTSWIILGLWRGIVYVIGIALTGVGLAATGLLMALRWGVKVLWRELAPRPVAVPPVMTPKAAVAKPASKPIYVIDWPTERHHILKVGDQNAEN